MAVLAVSVLEAAVLKLKLILDFIFFAFYFYFIPFWICLTMRLI